MNVAQKMLQTIAVSFIPENIIIFRDIILRVLSHQQLNLSVIVDIRHIHRPVHSKQTWVNILYHHTPEYCPIIVDTVSVTSTGL
jgi:hypothetical protein